MQKLTAISFFALYCTFALGAVGGAGEQPTPSGEFRTLDPREAAEWEKKHRPPETEGEKAFRRALYHYILEDYPARRRNAEEVVLGASTVLFAVESIPADAEQARFLGQCLRAQHDPWALFGLYRCWQDGTITREEFVTAIGVLMEERGAASFAAKRYIVGGGRDLGDFLLALVELAPQELSASAYHAFCYKLGWRAYRGWTKDNELLRAARVQFLREVLTTGFADEDAAVWRGRLEQTRRLYPLDKSFDGSDAVAPVLEEDPRRIVEHLRAKHLSNVEWQRQAEGSDTVPPVPLPRSGWPAWSLAASALSGLLLAALISRLRRRAR